MGTLKKLIGVGIITGVVTYIYLRSLSAKVNGGLLEPKNDSPQLV